MPGYFKTKNAFAIVVFQVELKHTVEILHEEQERIVKIDAIKKSLEVEVKVFKANKLK